MTLKRRAFRLGAVAATCALAAACAPSAARVPTPSPSPTRVTPAETQVEREIRQAFEAAEKAYRANWAEVGRLSRSGGAEKATTALKETSTGEYLKFQVGELNFLKNNGYRFSGNARVGWVHYGAFKQTSLKIIACEDFLGTTIFDRKNRVVVSKSSGTEVYQQDITVSLTKGRWKLSRFSSTQVKRC